jgi:RNA polymerase sigma-70 factor (ECF subfamily)
MSATMMPPEAEAQSRSAVSQERIPSFEELAIKLGPQLRAYLERMVRNAADADDLLQETLMRIARGLPAFEGRASVKNWSYRIASNVAIDFLRKSAKTTVVEFDETVADELEAGPGDEERLVFDEMNRCVREVIDSLPPEYRAALILHHLQGAEILEISLANAKVRIHRAKVRLREALGDACEFYTSEEGALHCTRKAATRDN